MTKEIYIILKFQDVYIDRILCHKQNNHNSIISACFITVNIMGALHADHSELYYIIGLLPI